jgi:hypothetical protein
MPKELRINLDESQMAKIDALGEFWGYRYRGETVAHMVNESHDRHLSRTHWTQQQAHAYRVLKRLKPELLLSIDEIVSVGFVEGGAWVTIGVALASQPFKVSREKWEQP